MVVIILIAVAVVVVVLVVIVQKVPYCAATRLDNPRYHCCGQTQRNADRKMCHLGASNALEEPT